MATLAPGLAPTVVGNTAPSTGMVSTAPSATASTGTSLALPQPGPVAVLSSLGGVLQQPAVRKAMPAIVMLVILLAFAALYFWMQEAPYRVVFPGMHESDQQSAFDALKTANLNPRIDAASGQLAVPSGRYHEARILLASQGLPKAQGRGILDSLKDQSAMTTSQFMEQARYAAAIEQELAKSITQIGSIQGARVHLAQTKQSAFVRDRERVKASVVVTPHGGRVVSPNQVQAIVHLVASSVPYLAVEDVSVVDNLGNLISKAPGDAVLGLTSVQTQHKQQVEDAYRKKILQLLEPVVGEGNVRAQVDLVLDFNQVEMASEDFDNRRTGPKTRSEVLSEERGGSSDAGGGVPGSLSNTAPGESKINPDSTATTMAEEKKSGSSLLNSKSTRNYELDKAVRHVRTSPGNIERVSVAVVIKEREPAPAPAPAPAGAGAGKAAPAAPAPAPAGYSAEELERLASLVKGVVGFSAERGDQVNLMPAKFDLPAPVVPLTSSWYENDVTVNGLKVALAALVVVVILLTVVRPVLVSLLLPAPVAALVAGVEPGADSMSMVEGESVEDFKTRLKKSAAPKKSSISAEMLDTANSYDDKVALVRMLVAEDSGRVANVLKNMIKRDAG